MAAGDARPVPRKNIAFRVYFPILDADGDFVSAAAALDSEVSIDGAAFADATSEATEIGTSGLYFLDLTAAEMNGDAVVVQVKTTTTGAKTTPIIMYPEEAGDYRAAVTSMGADVLTAAATAADFTTEIQAGLATSAALTTVSGLVDDLETRLTAARAGYLDNLSLGAVALSTQVDALEAAAIAIEADTQDLQSRVPAVLVAGRIDASVGAMAANVMTAASLAADAGTEIADAILARNIAGGSSTGRTVTSALRRIRNRVAIAAGTMTVYQEDDTTSDHTAVVTTAAGNPITQIDPDT